MSLPPPKKEMILQTKFVVLQSCFVFVVVFTFMIYLITFLEKMIWLLTYKSSCTFLHQKFICNSISDSSSRLSDSVDFSVHESMGYGLNEYMRRILLQKTWRPPDIEVIQLWICRSSIRDKNSTMHWQRIKQALPQLSSYWACNKTYLSKISTSEKGC